MLEVPRTMLFCSCLLAIVLVVAACAKDIEVQAKGQTAVSVGVGNR